MAVDAPAWAGEDVSVTEIERRLAELEHPDQEGVAELRTSVMTHLAWVPPEWEQAARDTLAGLGERHPSRGIVLLPDPDADEDRLDARVSLACYSLPDVEGITLVTDVIELRLRGRRAAAPASVVAPLLIADLPVFLRWRGRPPFARDDFQGLIRIADRLIVDSAEWETLPEDYGELAVLFEAVACSDIAWCRTARWRLALAEQWPANANVENLRVKGPPADASLLAGWLRSRLQRRVELVHEPADEIDEVEADGEAPPHPVGDPPTPSDLLSEELDRFTRDPVYEAAVRALL